MEKVITLRSVFSYMEDAERLGIFVRCPLHRRPSEIFDCVTCAHYRGLETGDRQVFRLRCAEPDPASRQRSDAARHAATALSPAS